MFCFDCKTKLKDTLSDTEESKIEYINNNGRKKKRKINVKYLTLIISVLCVTLISAAVLFALKNSKKSGGSNEVEAKSEIPETSTPDTASVTDSTDESHNESVVSQNSEETQPEDKPDASNDNQNENITVQYYDYTTLLSEMKAADEKYNLTTFDYSTFSLKDKYDFAGFTYGASLNQPGSSYTMISDQFETEFSISQKVAGTQLLLSKNTQSGEILAQCNLQHKPGSNDMYDSEKNFFKVVLHAVLQSDYDKVSDEINDFLNTDDLTLRNKIDFMEFYEKELDLGNAVLSMQVAKKDGDTTRISVCITSE
jgi:hypothetical protein